MPPEGYPSLSQRWVTHTVNHAVVFQNLTFMNRKVICISRMKHKYPPHAKSA